MNNYTLNFEDFSSSPKEKTVTLEMPLKENSLALIKDEEPLCNFTILPPQAVKTLIDNDVKVFMQHEFALHAGYSDMEYANVGVEFVDDFYLLANMTRLLIKSQPFTLPQVSLMSHRQIMFSTVFMSQVRAEYIHEINAKQITALAMNFIRNDAGNSIFEELVSVGQAEAVSVSLYHFLLPLLMSLVLNARLRFAMQKTPALMQSAYCFGGHLCNRDIAEFLHLPYKDIISLCWELN